jgi:hypothetical protein
MFILDGRTLPLDIPFEHDGIQYPANWLRLATVDERATIGITEEAEPEYYDDRFYWGVGNPKDLDGLKATWSSQVSQTAYSLLFPSDWMVVRSVETSSPLPSDWTTYRSAVRIKAAEVKAAITAVTDVESLISTVIGIDWPASPNGGQL